MCLLMASQMLSAQSFDSIFEECQEKGAMNLNMTKEMIKLAMALRKEQSQTAIMEKIDNMKMAIIPSPDSLFVEKIMKELEALETPKSKESEEIDPNAYTKVMMGEEKDKNQSVVILIKAEGEETVAPIVREFVIGAVSKEKGQQVLLVAQVLGRFNVDDLEALMRVANRRL
jgi:hypothetical protein